MGQNLNKRHCSPLFQIRSIAVWWLRMTSFPEAFVLFQNSLRQEAFLKIGLPGLAIWFANTSLLPVNLIWRVLSRKETRVGVPCELLKTSALTYSLLPLASTGQLLYFHRAIYGRP